MPPPPIAAEITSCGIVSAPMLETIAFGAFQPMIGPLMKLSGSAGDAGQLALDPVEDQLLELGPLDVAARELASVRQLVRCGCGRGVIAS